MKRKPQSAKKAIQAGEIPGQPSDVAVPAPYAALLAEIKERVRNAQLRAHLAVNRELVVLYWEIGRGIVSRQKHEGWGKAVIERLAADIQSEFPGMAGFSANNIWRMRAFYLAYASERILPQPVAEIAGAPGASRVLAQAAQELPPPEVLAIPWFHNVILIQKIKECATRLWYARHAAQHGWSRARLVETLPASIKDAVPSITELGREFKGLPE